MYILVQGLSHQRNKGTDVLFKLIGIGGSPCTEIGLPYNQNNLGIAIGTCMQWKRSEWVTLTELESGYTEK